MYGTDDGCLCQDCFNKTYFECDCGGVFRIDDGLVVDDVVYCEDCFDELEAEQEVA